MRIHFVSVLLLSACSCKEASDRCVAGDCAPVDGGPSDCSLPAFEAIPVDEEVPIEGLDAPVDILRDEHGMPHVYADTLDQAVLAQGFIIARDRMAQMELFRRTASGDLAELVGVLVPEQIDSDIFMRVMGLRRQAAAQWAATPAGGEAEAVQQAFADGVNAYLRRIADGSESAPDATNLLVSRNTRPWDPVDSLVIGRLEQWDLSWDGDDAHVQAVFDALGATFAAGAADAEDARRAGVEADLFDLRPSELTFTLGGFPASAERPGAAGGRPRLSDDLAKRVDPWIARPHLFGVRPEAGSNDWIVSGQHTESGAAMLANDPHLSLYSPSIFYLVHLDSKRCGDGTSVAGVTLPGVPGVVLGFNEHVAWGATNTGYDVTDTYLETIVDGDSVFFDGAPVPLETRTEVVNDGVDDHDVQVQIVPHHGPLVPTIAGGAIEPVTGSTALSWRWVGFEAERGNDLALHDFDTFFGLSQATSVAEAIDALGSYSTGAQNWVVVDDAGALGYTTHGLVPQRDARAMTFDARTNPDGLAPCFVLPGTGEAEWTGWLEEDRIPQARDPDAGYLVTANADPVGVTADGNPFTDERYIGWSFDPGHRATRITRLLEEKIAAGELLTAQDMARIQSDHRSPLGARIVPFVLAAMARADEEAAAPRTHRDLEDVVAGIADYARLQAARDRLAAWSFEAADGVEAEIGETDVADSIATSIFNDFLVHLRADSVGDELERAGLAVGDQRMSTVLRMLEAPATLAVVDPDTSESVLWDDIRTDRVHESRDAILVASLARAVDDLVLDLGADDDAWRWGSLHALRTVELIPGFAMPPPTDATYPNGYPRHSDQYDVDAAGHGFDDTDFTFDSGPVQRLVVEMVPGALRAFDVIPGGAVGDPSSPFFANDLELWRHNENHPVAFYPEDVAAAAVTRIRLVPAS